MKRMILHFFDFSAFMVALIGASAMDWTPAKIAVPVLIIPMIYIGLREWAEKEAYEKSR